MSLVIPEVKGLIKKITIFPPTYYIEIIMIHRLMMDHKKKILPITIINAKTTYTKLLRDISVTLASMYISKCDNIEFIANYFKIAQTDVSNIIINTIKTNHKELLEYQNKLKIKYSICFGWDVENDCELTMKRLKYLEDKFKPTIKQRFSNGFTPTWLKTE